ncbi:hypothetical protein [Hoyosella subflava]|uniref:Putative phosphodiesterase n=1 Tax=Hoyosella subflava (strain DSM 45089 / JCM 17490 / NBRC 109087 / DQS3-9A1) TaxID=443218 RepID=F6EH31_HOYSD|nr:hypothetical protein [Hoyosella subflava]AEF39868.1 Putative phosphodiesterase [Hoyosella subflava DQS3-9A1]
MQLAQPSGRIASLTRAAAKAAARLRSSGRLFHPWGECFSGTINFALPDTAGVPEEHSCLVRLSKGAGLGAALPDALGLAIRIESSNPWDILMVSSGGTGRLGRMIIKPSAFWTAASYSTLMPYQRADGTLTWLHARPSAERKIPARKESLTAAIEQSPLRFTLSSSNSQGEVHRIGELILEQQVRTELSFDPGVNHANNLRLYPRWLAAFRSDAYSGSRQSRGATLRA